MSWAGELQGGGFRVLVKTDDGQSFPSEWLPNSYRFSSEVEADCFIKNAKATWVPEGFIHSTRTVKSRDPVNGRWNDQKQEAVLLPPAPANEPVVTAAAAIQQEQAEDDYDKPMELEELDEEPAALVDEERYRPTVQKMPKRRFSLELFRAYRDETQWFEREQQFETSLAGVPKGYGLISDTIRGDLRNLLTHGNCRLEISRRMLDAFMVAHGGKVPDKSIDTGKRRLNACKKKLFEAYQELCIASDGADQKKINAAQTTYNRMERSYAAAGGDLSAWRSATSGEIVDADENGPIRVKPPIMKNIWEILRVSKLEFDWEAAAPAVSMLDLTRWLATAQGHAAIGWFSDHQWHGPAQTSQDLIAALDIKQPLNLQDLEAAELAAKMLRRKQLAERLVRFNAVFSEDYLQQRLQLEKERQAKQQQLEMEYEAAAARCRLPDLKKLVAKHGGDHSRVSMKEWNDFNHQIEAWKTCIGVNDNWSDPNWRRWFVRKKLKIWGVGTGQK